MTPTPKPAPFTVLDSRIAWSCPWYAVRQDRLRTPDGTEYTYNIVDKNHAVWIVPVTAQDEIVLIHNYRPSLREWCWELPAGGIEAGQTPDAAARQELREEVGGTAAAWRFLLRAATMNGMGNELAYVYLATGVTLGAPHHEPLEAMTIHPTPRAEAVRMARAGEINDATSVMAILLAEPLLDAARLKNQ